MTEEYEQVKADVEAEHLRNEQSDGEHGADAMSVNTLEEARFKIDFLSGMCIKAQGEVEDLKAQLKEQEEDGKKGFEEIAKKLKSAQLEISELRNRRWELEEDKRRLIEAISHFSAAVVED